MGGLVPVLVEHPVEIGDLVGRERGARRGITPVDRTAEVALERRQPGRTELVGEAELLEPGRQSGPGAAGVVLVPHGGKPPIPAGRVVGRRVSLAVMTRELRHLHASRAYPVRQLVAYRRLIVNRERIDPERVVAEYIRANPQVDLEAQATFAEWDRGTLPGDTAQRIQGLPIR